MRRVSQVTLRRVFHASAAEHSVVRLWPKARLVRIRANLKQAALKPLKNDVISWQRSINCHTRRVSGASLRSDLRAILRANESKRLADAWKRDVPQYEAGQEVKEGIEPTSRS